MDSFFSLFDPSDGQSKSCHKKRHKAGTIDDNVRKKTEPNVPKGRRRGRRGQGKNETLPEESSFLCDPELSTELLVKDGSYIENYFEANHSKKYEEQKQQGDAKPKQRSSGRKSRRRKSKVSPAKDFAAHSGWSDELSDCVEDETLNNVSCPQPRRSGVVNKIVNNLRGDGEVELECGNKGRRKEGSSSFEEIQVNNVIDKLEKVSLKDDMYMAGEISAEDLENDVFYSSDDMDESYDDSDSELEATSDEVYGSLPPEPRFGNVEYKLQLVAPGERRLQHLVTQLKWRLISGGGSCIYVVGVRDCGALRGLRARALRGSLRTLRRMAAALRATLTHVTARRVTPHRAVAEVYIRKLADTQQSVELRVAVMGANEAGKSTLIGVLTQGELDNGRGSARLNMFRHVHEVRSGRTSSLSHEILGFDARGNVVNYGCSELMTAERIGERSAKLVSFLDLAGHSKYQHTTVHGLTGYSPHYAMLVVSATAGITRITEEHIDLLIALDLPFFTVLNKCELEPQAAAHTLARLAQLLAKTNKKPMLITDETLARECVAPPKLILDCIDEGAESVRGHEDQTEIVPVFPVSCVKGTGLNALHAYLLALQPPAVDIEPLPEEESCEFQIDEIFHVGDSAGPVVGGLQARGRLREGDNLLIGPLDTGEFVEISVKTIYRNRVPCSSVKAGQSASLGLTHHPPNLRQGMVLLAIPENYKKNNKTRPVFGRCPPGRCKSRNIKHIAETKNVKGVRRKEKNILQDLALVENCLKKTDDGVRENIFVDVGDKLAGSGETKKFGGDERNNNYCGDDADDSGLKFSDEDDKCYCGEEVPLDDPDDPRGCFYFQATLHLLRHSTPYIHPGFQCTVHVGNVRQTAVIEAIMSGSGVLRAGCRAQVVFRFVRAPEYVRARRRLLCRAGLATRAVGDTAQVFPHVTRC